MKLSELPVRVVRPMDDPPASKEEIRKTRYSYTVAWRAKNRERRNQLDREWRARRKAARR